MGYEVDIQPARPWQQGEPSTIDQPARSWQPREPSYLDAYKRRMYKSFYVKPKVEAPNYEPRGYLEGFETHEAEFRPDKRQIRPEFGYQDIYRLGKGPGVFELEPRAVHLGNNCRIVTPSSEWWKRGRRYFIPTSGAWSETKFKPSLRYIDGGLSNDQTWKPCLRVYKVKPTEYYDFDSGRRRYLPQQYGFEDKYEQLTEDEAYSQAYSPRKIDSISKFKPESFGYFNDGVPDENKPFKKKVTMYLRRHPPLQLFGPDPPIVEKPLRREVAEYLLKHPQLQLFSADFRPELNRTHSSYVSKTRFDPIGRYDHFEDDGLTIQTDVRLPEPPGAQHTPINSPRMIHNQYLIVR